MKLIKVWEVSHLGSRSFSLLDSFLATPRLLMILISLLLLQVQQSSARRRSRRQQRQNRSRRRSRTALRFSLLVSVCTVCSWSESR